MRKRPRLSPTLIAAQRAAKIAERRQHVPKGYRYTLADTKFILARGKRAWRLDRFGA